MARPQYFDTNCFTIPVADAAISEYQRVKLSATGVAVADPTDKGCGFAERAAAIGEAVSIRGMKSPSFIGLSAAAITKGATVYGGTSGLVTSTDGGSYELLGVALTAAAGAAEAVTIVPH